MNGGWIGLVLAAGKGTRMKSDLAKVLHEIEGKTLLAHVLETAARLPLRRIILVVGHQAEEVAARHAGEGIETALQVPQRGTGHAVMVAAPLLEREPAETSLLVLYGDVPLLRETTLAELMESHLLEGSGVTVLTARVPDPSGYGRILREEDGSFRSIVEDRDLTPDQRQVNEINSGIYAFRLKSLLDVLGRLDDHNSQGEYYLTDTLRLIRDRGEKIGVFLLSDAEEISGINTPEQLAEAGSVLARRRAEEQAGNDGCPVCRGVAAEAHVLERRRGIAALLNPRPYNSGHVWVAPERHVTRYESLTAEEREDLLCLARDAEAWCDSAFHPEGFNLGYNSGTSGEHLTMHVIPRWPGDSNFMPLIGGVNLLPETLEQSRRRLLEARERGASARGGPA